MGSYHPALKMWPTTSGAGDQSHIKPHEYEHILTPFVKLILLCNKQVICFFWWEIRRSAISLQLSSITFLIPWMLQISFLISTTLELNMSYVMLGLGWRKRVGEDKRSNFHTFPISKFFSFVQKALAFICFIAIITFFFLLYQQTLRDENFSHHPAYIVFIFTEHF